MWKDFFEDSFSLYERLGEFYETKGYSSVSHTRMRRYEILLEFLRTVEGVSEETVSDRMICDLYLRENLKSRPSFARDQKSCEKAVWEYRRMNKIPKLPILRFWLITEFYFSITPIAIV